MNGADALTSGPVLVVGTGLLGASIGAALSSLGVPVLLTDQSPTALALAVDLGAGRPLTPADAPELVVVATPPDVAGEVVVANLSRFPNATVTDVASVKQTVLAAASAGDLSRYVGCHPMAGREQTGPIAARADLFVGRPWVIVTSGCSRPQSLSAVRNLALDLGAAPIPMDARAHDAAVALISHMPQVMSSLIAAQLHQTDPSVLSLAGQGLRDVTRIAASDPQLWTAILAANAKSVTPVLQRVREQLDNVIAALSPAATAAHATIAGTIAAGNSGVARIPGKHGAVAQSFETIAVLVPDEPGELARLLTDMGRAGINLEDLYLEHAPRHRMGVAVISVLPGVRANLEETLNVLGWRVA